MSVVLSGVVLIQGGRSLRGIIHTLFGHLIARQAELGWEEKRELNKDYLDNVN